MSVFFPFLRRHQKPAVPTDHDLAPDAETVVEDRPSSSPLSLDKLIPEDVDPALLRVRENLDGK